MKKIKYSNIEKSALKITLGDCFNLGEYTLKDELDKYGEDIIFAQYVVKDGKFEFFNAWTKSFVMCLIRDLFGDFIILGSKRNPPNE